MIKGSVLAPDGGVFGTIWDHNVDADEVTVLAGGKQSVVVSAHSLIPTDDPEVFQLAYEIDLDFESLTDKMREVGRKFDGGKLDWTLLPVEAIEDVVKVLEFGAQKYGRSNWTKVEDGHRRYLAAAYRHLVAIQKGEQFDPESGLPHAAHAVCCLLFLGYFDA